MRATSSADRLGRVMKIAVEAWAPEYGSAYEPGELDAASAPVELGLEVPADHWSPIAASVRPDGRTGRPAGDGHLLEHEAATEPILFVDGVRRVDAWVWITDAEGQTHAGIAASYAAGAVLCDGAATVVAAEVSRRVFSPAVTATLDTTCGPYLPAPVAGDDLTALMLALQRRMGELEARVATAHAGPGRRVVVDGPLRQPVIPGAVGYVKTHHVSYLPPTVREVVARLGAGERTPLFLIGGAWPRWSWYLRVGAADGHPWAGIVRCEIDAGEAVQAAAAQASEVSAVLPPFASAAHKDPRAPQNLYPIGGLERDLRHRLGDPQIMLRALRRAVGAQ
jgi:hypothetical protein